MNNLNTTENLQPTPDPWISRYEDLPKRFPEYAYQRVSYGAHPQQELYLSIPKTKGAGPFPVVIWYHGGGLVGDIPDAPLQLWDGRLALVEVRYRTVGETSNSLDALEDAANACAWLLEHIASYGCAPNQLFLGGISAGAWLSAMLGMNPNILGQRNHDLHSLKGLILVTGQLTTHFQVKLDLAYPRTGVVPVIDQYAPIYWMAAALPPIVCITGSEGFDWPGRPAENAYMVQMLKVLGHKDATHIILDGFTHGAVGDNCGYSVLQFLNTHLEN